MKLEVGMFIRTPLGIDRIKDTLGCYSALETNGVLRWNNDEKVNWFSIDGECFDKKELKASHTLLGNDKEPSIIGRGDYVNGEEVCGLYEYNGKRYADVDRVCYLEEEIKSIVTKEQFEAMEYKVGDE